MAIRSPSSPLAVLAVALTPVLAGCAFPSPGEEDDVSGSREESVRDPVDVRILSFTPETPAPGEAFTLDAEVKAVWGNATSTTLTVESPSGVHVDEAPSDLGNLRVGAPVPIRLAFTVTGAGEHLVALRVSTQMEAFGPVGGYRQFYAVTDGTGPVALHVDHLPPDPHGRAEPCEDCGDPQDAGAPPHEGEVPGPANGTREP